MTREQKIEWLANATSEQVVNQMRWATIATVKADTIAKQIEAQEDFELVKEELLKRLA